MGTLLGACKEAPMGLGVVTCLVTCVGPCVNASGDEHLVTSVVAYVCRYLGQGICAGRQSNWVIGHDSGKVTDYGTGECPHKRIV